jgi:hypothetical protein
MGLTPETEDLRPFSLLGGPLHRLGDRLGLVRDRTNTVPLGLAIGLSLWIVQSIQSVMHGANPFALAAIGTHARLLLAIPLLFACESLLDPRVAQFLRQIVRSAVVPNDAVPELQEVITRITRWKDAWLPEALCLLATSALWWIVPLLWLPGAVIYDRDPATPDLLSNGWWYWVICLTVFRFLVLRWLWLLCRWFYVLWRLSGLRLHLVSIHPDGAGGLGYLEVVHANFGPAVLAFSIVLSASLAVDIGAGRTTLEGILPSVFVMLLIDIALFVGPLFVFSPKLWACRVEGLSDFIAFAQRYVGKFEEKWLRANSDPGEQLLGTGDIQSLADLGNGADRVRNMRITPVSKQLFIQIAVVALLPLLPLVLFKYPLAELASQVFKKLAGL